MVFAEIDFIDSDGNTAWTANGEVTVSAEGGRVIGTGSGRIDDTHDYTTSVCSAYRGRQLAAIIPEGETVKITACAGDMRAETEVKVK